MVVVMLTPLSENGVKQCHLYWPDEGADVYHIYEVRTVPSPAPGLTPLSDVGTSPHLKSSAAVWTGESGLNLFTCVSTTESESEWTGESSVDR